MRDPHLGSTPAPAVTRALMILEHLATVSPEARMTDIAEALAINKSTCFNILKALADYGAVVRDDRYPVYRLGPKMVELGTASRRHFSHREAIRGELDPLVRQLGVTAIITQPLPSLGGFVVVDRLIPARDDALTAPIGHVYPVTAPAMGRAFLAAEGLETSMIDILSETDLGPQERQQLNESVRLARESGYGVSANDQNVGVNAVAAAVRGAVGNVEVLLCLFGYDRHLPASDLPAAGRQVADAARAIEARIR